MQPHEELRTALAEISFSKIASILGVILAGLAASAFWRSSRAPAVAGLAVLTAYAN